jgi:hypothetical protein
MSQQSRTTLKTYFNDGDIPTEEQYGDLIDSFYNLSDDTAEDLTINSLQLNTAPTGITPAEGLIWYNADDRTANLGLAGGSTLQIGEENVVYAKNTTGSQIDDGTVVYASGATGANLLMDLADASDLTKCSQVGVVTQDIANNAFGYVTTFGFVRDVDTTGGAESWSVLDALYVSPTTPGALTNVVPSSPNFTTPVGIVTKVHATLGVIGVNPDWPKATNTSLGTSNVVAPTQGAVNTAIDSKFKGGALVANSAAQTIGNSVGVNLTFDTDTYDTDSIHDTVSNTDRLVVPAGVSKVRVSYRVGFTYNATGYRRAGIFYSADANAVGMPLDYAAPIASVVTYVGGTSAVVNVTPGAYFYIEVFQTSGGDLNTVSGAGENTWFSLEIVERS